MKESPCAARRPIETALADAAMEPFVRDVGAATPKNWSSLMTGPELKSLLGGKDQLRLSRLAEVGSQRRRVLGFPRH